MTGQHSADELLPMSRSPFPRQFSPALLLGLAALACLLLNSCGLFRTAVGVGMIKIRFGCLVEGSPIDTPTGPVLVENLHTGDRIIGFDGALCTVLQVHQYHEDVATSRHLTVRFSDGAEIQLSPRHRIAGIPAGELVPGDRVDGHVVIEVRPLGGVARSFDLLTEDQGYRIHGIPVNSMIEEMAGR